MQFIVCPKCDSIYRQEDCIQTVFGIQESTRCLHKPNPARPNKFDTMLKRVKSGTSSKLLPKKFIHTIHCTKALIECQNQATLLKCVKFGEKYAQDPN